MKLKLKLKPNLKSNNGFTLIELLATLLVLSILFAIIMPTFSGFVNSFKYKVLQYNTSTLEDLVELYAYDFDKSDWYGSWNENNLTTLNNYIEIQLEIINSGKYENNSNFVNPFSQNKSILDYNTTVGSGDGYRPAVFLTSNTSFSYSTFSGSTNLVGSIVAYFSVSGGKTNYIDFYYIKNDGKKSEFKTRLE